MSDKINVSDNISIKEKVTQYKQCDYIDIYHFGLELPFDELKIPENVTVDEDCKIVRLGNDIVRESYKYDVNFDALSDKVIKDLSLFLGKLYYICEKASEGKEKPKYKFEVDVNYPSFMKELYNFYAEPTQDLNIMGVNLEWDNTEDSYRLKPFVGYPWKTGLKNDTLLIKYLNVEDVSQFTPSLTDLVMGIVETNSLYIRDVLKECKNRNQWHNFEVTYGIVC